MKRKDKTQSTGWHVVLWVVQVVLAAFFLFAGYMKTFVPLEELALSVPLAGEMPVLTRFIGVVEVLGGLGLVLPVLLRILPALTILAAYGIAMIMVLALFYHMLRGEYEAIGTNVVLGLAAVFIGWGRTSRASVSARPVL